MTADTETAVAPTVRQRLRSARWVVVALIVISGVALLTTYLTTPTPGARMDPASTSADGARALVSLVRDRGVEVVEASDIAAVEAAARPDTLVVVVQTYFLIDEEIMHRLAALPGDRLVVQPISRTREILAPEVKRSGTTDYGNDAPGCDLREATRAGSVQFGMSDAFEAAGDIAVTRCYGGALVRYTADGRDITVVSTADFMTNSELLKEGNAALAMNLVGTNPRVIWYAPQQTEGESDGAASLFDMIPDRVNWIVWQLCLVVLLLAIWRGRRIGPLVAEKLPVVVRASETVEGRGRLYRSTRSRDRAAEALRTAAVQRMSPRLGLGPGADQTAVVQSVSERCGQPPQTVAYSLFGPAPADDTQLVNLARELDNIERQVAQS
ncbi:DUF4350 domain-containing protein [Mycolicibacterium sp. XJ2546]